MKLVRFLMKCQGETVTIELKSGGIVAGTIASVSPNMNTAMRNVKYSMRGAATVQYDNINIRGNEIRYFILPDMLNLDALLVDDAPKPKNKARKDADKAASAGRGGGRGGPRGGRGGRGGRGRGRGGRGF